nr:immunoglobulin light chain junction region [Macaca mulatta]MPN92304.1 immunoglobulin light chain junction region [Macaca mulatta]
CLQGDSAPLTF